jgi:hypothetical protein
MRRMLIALAVGLQLFSGLTWADELHSHRHGDSRTIVHWNAVVGLHGQAMGEQKVRIQ